MEEYLYLKIRKMISNILEKDKLSLLMDDVAVAGLCE
jgi:hypothetical protein